MIRIAILSFAHYHANFWAEAFQSLSDIEVVAIWDDNLARGREAAGRFKVRFEPDLENAISAADAVAVCSETIGHAPLIERAVAAKRAVLCEKPLAANSVEALRIEKAVRSSSVPFMQSFPKRFDPVSHELKRIVDSGELGKVRLVRARHGHFYGLDPEFRERWYVDPALSGGGALLDEGVHVADFLCWLFGMPAGVIASASSSLGLKVEDQAIAVYDYAGGMLAEVTSSFSFAAADASIEIYGSEGTAIVSGVDLASRDITPSGHLRIFLRSQSERIWRVSPLIPRFKLGQFHHQNAFAFADTLRRKAPPPVTLDDGLRSAKMIFTAYEAIRTGVRAQF